MKKITQTILVSLFATVFILFSVGCPSDTQDTKNNISGGVL